MEKTKITFADGSVIEADKNGDCFIVDKEFSVDDLSKVTIGDGDNVQVLKNVKIVAAASVDGRFWFSFHKVIENPVAKLQANVEYIAMMSNISLEEV